ncbi:hypothetical protein GUJ93_ZPchr0011g28317 [Zizania palustris]|uniref:Uncharacterized protein n=1 Tax=Zizania palustris TaxID=103762 RepID=A0A8J6BSZ7_ZIZPA|nr:hypothetical protein GUJ93_ZPchr0011g28317 [Zizania palustris]
MLVAMCLPVRVHVGSMKWLHAKCVHAWVIQVAMYYYVLLRLKLIPHFPSISLPVTHLQDAMHDAPIPEGLGASQHTFFCHAWGCSIHFG